jgi:hypothetical protein
MFYYDLKKEVSKWKNEGCHIIIGIDANEDVRTGATAEFFKEAGMREIILHTHKKNSPPATCDKNNNRQPIDGIFTTFEINITAGGYFPFNSGCASDHRPIWIDVPYNSIFGHATSPIVNPPPRRLNNKNPRLVEKYNKQLKKTLDDEKILQRLDKLHSDANKNGWSHELENEYNEINDKQYIIRSKIESKIRRLRTGMIPWSPRLQKHRTNIEIWSMLIKKKKGQKVSNKKIRRLLKKTDIKGAYDMSLLQLQDAINNAFSEYKKARSDAATWRDEFLEDLASARAKHKGTKKEVELKQLRHIEAQKTVARNIKRMRGKLNRTATTQVYVNNDEGRRLVTSKDGIELACIQENDSRFSQSENTPPMTEPLLSDLGMLADTEQAQKILEGTYECPPGTDKYAALLINELRMPDNVVGNPVPTTEITPDLNRDGWNKQRETVSSDPYGLSFSHYKAAAQDDALNRFDAQLRNLPYKYGFSPSHWQNITDVEILKKAGIYDIDKMRTITLMDAAFNMNNKQLGRDLMKHAELLNNISREQYGSRKRHRSCVAATNKVLTMDLLRMRKQAGSICSNDAKSCFDRIVHNVATIAMIRQGAPPNAVRSMFSTLQQSNHRIRTAFGISRRKYGKGRLPPLQGIGQGNGAAPPGWVVISTPLINMMKTAGFGLQLLTCLSCLLISFICYAFVDDTDLVHTTASVDTTGDTVLSEMQKFVTHWEGGLRATGGALRVDKSCWYLIDFIWSRNKWRYATKDDFPGDIQVRDADGCLKILPRLEPNQANETLGIYLAMDGNHQEEINKLRSKAEEFAGHVRTSMVTREEAWYSLHSTVMKTLEYPMEALSLTKNQWDFIMAPILKTVLPKSGIVRTFPRDILYGPEEQSGFGLIHPFYLQNFKKLELLMREYIENSITSELLKANIEQLRLESGLPGRTKWKFSKKDSWRTEGWINSLLQFCNSEDLEILDQQPELQAIASDDKFLMELFIDLGYSDDTLQTLNECRMSLKAITLGDLCNADGKHISINSFQGKANLQRKAGWPRKPPSLPTYFWNTWRKALTKLCLPNSNNRRLINPIGTWNPNVKDQWIWFFSPSESRLFKKQGIIFSIYIKATHSRNRSSSSRYKRTALTCLAPPKDALLATIHKNNDQSVYLSSTGSMPNNTSSNEPNKEISLDETMDRIHPLDKWAVEEYDVPEEGVVLAEAIKLGTATAVSDGSFRYPIGTSGFILRGLNRKLAAIGVNTVPGNVNEQSSFRSELAGISGIIAIVSTVCLKHRITSGSILIALDGQQAMLKVSSDYPPSPTDPDYDLITDIRRKISKLPIKITFQWIEGHQDKTMPKSSLSPLAQDNILADGLAKNHLNDLYANNYIPLPQRFADEAITLILEGKKISHLDPKKLYAHMWANKSIDYWANKHKIDFSNAIEIDWEVCGKAIRSLTFAKKRRMIKHATGHFGVGTKMKLWKFQEHDKCPMCDLREDPPHIIKCKDKRSRTAWNDALINLQKWMEANKTDPHISQCIILRLTEWHDDKRISPLPWNSTAKKPDKSQRSIGWYPFLLGHVSNYWKETQQKYYTMLQLQNTGKQWARKLILQLFNISWDLWELRNGIKHNTLTPEKLRETILLNQKITNEFELGHETLLPRDHAWLSKPINSIIDNYTIKEKHKWLISIEQARERRRNRSNNLSRSQIASRTSFEKWLNYKPKK